MSGVPHDHREFQEWCFRCHLSRDEIAARCCSPAEYEPDQPYCCKSENGEQANG